MVVGETPFSERQIIIEDSVEDVRPVEERWPVVQACIITGRIVAGVVLNSANRVERFGKRVVEVEEQSVPAIVAQRQDQSVVVRFVPAGAHKEVEHLCVRIFRQSEPQPGKVHAQEKI